MHRRSRNGGGTRAGGGRCAADRRVPGAREGLSAQLGLVHRGGRRADLRHDRTARAGALGGLGELSCRRPPAKAVPSPPLLLRPCAAGATPRSRSCARVRDSRPAGSSSMHAPRSWSLCRRTSASISASRRPRATSRRSWRSSFPTSRARPTPTRCCRAGWSRRMPGPSGTGSCCRRGSSRCLPTVTLTLAEMHLNIRGLHETVKGRKIFWTTAPRCPRGRRVWFGARYRFDGAVPTIVRRRSISCTRLLRNPSGTGRGEIPGTS